MALAYCLLLGLGPYQYAANKHSKKTTMGAWLTCITLHPQHSTVQTAIYAAQNCKAQHVSSQHKTWCLDIQLEKREKAFLVGYSVQRPCVSGARLANSHFCIVLACLAAPCD